MKYAYNTGNFKTHLKNCNGPSTTSKLPSGGMKTLTSMLQQNPQVIATTKKKLFVPSAQPCPGLSKDNNAKIEIYLKRSGAQGGGSKSVTVTTKALFGKNTML
jgi:hypothetical protein